MRLILFGEGNTVGGTAVITSQRVMKKTMVRFILAATFALTFAGCATPKSPTDWEYKVEIVTKNLVGANNVLAAEKTINEMAQKGWQFVSLSTGGDEPNVVLVFKRKK